MDTLTDMEEAARNLVAERDDLLADNARLRAEVEQWKDKFCEVVKAKQCIVADLARVTRERDEWRGRALAELAVRNAVAAERDALAHGFYLLRSKYQSQRAAGADVTRLDGLLADIADCAPPAAKEF